LSGGTERGERQTALQRLAGALVAHPFVYDLVQDLAGQKKVAARLSTVLARLSTGRDLDVGSSSGGLASRLGLSPVCVDIDPRPLLRLRRLARATRAVAGDAARLPFPDRTFDLTLTVFLFHHLDDETVHGVLPELARVTSGRLLFLEPLRNDRRAISRWLWRYDRGRHPRTRPALVALLERSFELVKVEEFAVYHEYLLCVGKPLRAPART